jgi:hypothetical protein
MNTNKYCTRQMAVCNFLPKFLEGSDRYIAEVACNETVSFGTCQRTRRFLTSTRLS